MGNIHSHTRPSDELKLIPRHPVGRAAAGPLEAVAGPLEVAADPLEVAVAGHFRTQPRQGMQVVETAC